MTMISSFITTFDTEKKVKNFDAVLKAYESRQASMSTVSEVFSLIFEETQKTPWLNRTEYLKHLLSLNTFKLFVVIQMSSTLKVHLQILCQIVVALFNELQRDDEAE